MFKFSITYLGLCSCGSFTFRGGCRLSRRSPVARTGSLKQIDERWCRVNPKLRYFTSNLDMCNQGVWIWTSRIWMYNQDLEYRSETTDAARKARMPPEKRQLSEIAAYNSSNVKGLPWLPWLPWLIDKRAMTWLSAAGASPSLHSLSQLEFLLPVFDFTKSGAAWHGLNYEVDCLENSMSNVVTQFHKSCPRSAFLWLE